MSKATAERSKRLKKLETAPGFDKDAKWPDFADRTWGAGIYKYYGYDPYWKS